jgi:glycogen operon protein
MPDESGKPFPLGSTLYSAGVNFSIFCRNGETVELLFFDHEDDLNPSREMILDSNVNKTYHYWHIFVPGAKIDQLYGYLRGPHDPTAPQWRSDKIL